MLMAQGTGVGDNHKGGLVTDDEVLQGKLPPLIKALHLRVVFPAEVDSWPGLSNVQKETGIKEHVSLQTREQATNVSPQENSFLHQLPLCLGQDLVLYEL